MRMGHGRAIVPAGPLQATGCGLQAGLLRRHLPLATRGNRGNSAAPWPLSPDMPAGCRLQAVASCDGGWLTTRLVMYSFIRIYGLTETRLHPRPPLGTGRRHARPAAAAARAARADGVRAVRRAAVAAVHGQPAPEGAGRRRVGHVARGGHEPALYDGARGARRADAPAVAARARTGGRPRAATQDHHRLQGVLAERRTKSQEFFSSAAGQWDRLREELFGPTFHLQALLGLIAIDWVVGDLGGGTGAVAAALAPFVARVIAVDNSAAMLQAARRRLHGFDERGAPPRRPRGAPDRRRSARRRHADARAAITRRSPSACCARPRACSSRVDACSSPTCCRTIAKVPPADGSRAARDSRKHSRGASRGCRIRPRPPAPAPRRSARKGTGPVRAVARRRHARTTS